MQLLPIHEQSCPTHFNLQKSYNEKLSAFIQLNLNFSMYHLFCFFDVHGLSANHERTRAYHVSVFVVVGVFYFDGLSAKRSGVLHIR